MKKSALLLSGLISLSVWLSASTEVLAEKKAALKAIDPSQASYDTPPPAPALNTPPAPLPANPYGGGIQGQPLAPPKRTLDNPNPGPGPGIPTQSGQGWSPPAQPVDSAVYEPRVSRLEQMSFGSPYPEHEIEDRLDHLENEVFSKKNTGMPVDQRVARLESKLLGQTAFGQASAPTGPPQGPGSGSGPPWTGSQSSGSGYYPVTQPPQFNPAPAYQAPPAYQSPAPRQYGSAPQSFPPQQNQSGPYSQAPVQGYQYGNGSQPPPRQYGSQPAQSQNPYSGFPQQQNSYGFQNTRPQPGFQNPGSAQPGYQNPGPQAYPSPVQGTQGFPNVSTVPPNTQAAPLRPVQQAPIQQAAPVQPVPSQPAQQPVSPQAVARTGQQVPQNQGQANSNPGPKAAANSESENIVKSIPVKPAVGDYFASISRFSGGSVARWKTFPVLVHLPEGSPATWQKALTEAVESWGRFIPVRVAAVSEAADVEIAWINHLPPRALGQTNLEVFNGRMRVTVYLLRPSYYLADTSQKVLRKVAEHEVGHAIGIFGHSNDPYDLMFPIENLNTKEGTKYGAISPRDLNTLRRIYEAAPLPSNYQSPHPMGWSLKY